MKMKYKAKQDSAVHVYSVMTYYGMVPYVVVSGSTKFLQVLLPPWPSTAILHFTEYNFSRVNPTHY